MAKVNTFEENISEIDEIISKLEDGMDLDESMKEYENKDAREMCIAESGN